MKLSFSGNAPEMFPRQSLSARNRKIQGSVFPYLPVPGQSPHLLRPEARSHPEAVLSEHGYHLIQNFIQICEKWWEKQ